MSNNDVMQAHEITGTSTLDIRHSILLDEGERLLSVLLANVVIGRPDAGATRS